MGPIGLLSFIIKKISVLGDAQVYRCERGRALKAVLVLFFCTVFLHFDRNDYIFQATSGIYRLYVFCIQL